MFPTLDNVSTETAPMLGRDPRGSIDEPERDLVIIIYFGGAFVLVELCVPLCRQSCSVPTSSICYSSFKLLPWPKVRPKTLLCPYSLCFAGWSASTFLSLHPVPLDSKI